MARLILIADDSPTIQKKAQMILKSVGFEVETVSNGVAAIKKLSILQPALVLADVSMPGRDGYEVCEYIKTSADFHHVPVLLVASDLEPYDEQKGAQVGADGIIKKPFENQELVALAERFARNDESASPASVLLDSVFEASRETAPLEEEPEGVTGSADRDLSVPADMAFAEPQPDQISAVVPASEPIPEIPLPPLPDVEHEISQASSIFETPAEVPPEPAAGGPESFDETPLEIASEPAAAEPAPVEMTDLQPEPVSAFPEPAPEVAPEAWTELAPVPPEPMSEEVQPSAETSPEVPPSLEMEEHSHPTGPVLLEEPMGPVPEPDHVHDHVEPLTETTMAFQVPVDILEPVLRDDLAPAYPVAESLSPAAEQHPESAGPTSLDSFSLAEAWERPVSFSPEDAGPSPEQAPVVAPPVEAAEAALPGSGPQGVQAVVRKAVMKMAPPALPPEVVEDLVRQLTEEITAELAAESSLTQ